ncbi:unnamed protein product [Urochloa humidicola]
MADPHPVLGIDLNVPVREDDPEEDDQVEQQPVVEIYISNLIDWDEVEEVFFIWTTPYCFHEPEEGDE